MYAIEEVDEAELLDHCKTPAQHARIQIRLLLAILKAIKEKE